MGQERLCGLDGQRCELPALVVTGGAGRDLKEYFDRASTFDSPGTHGWDGFCFGSGRHREQVYAMATAR